eukprot:1215506-Alexandrium_andersonii.AAC.1
MSAGHVSGKEGGQRPSFRQCTSFVSAHFDGMSCVCVVMAVVCAFVQVHLVPPHDTGRVSAHAAVVSAHAGTFTCLRMQELPHCRRTEIRVCPHLVNDVCSRVLTACWLRHRSAL